MSGWTAPTATVAEKSPATSPGANAMAGANTLQKQAGRSCSCWVKGQEWCKVPLGAFAGNVVLFFKSWGWSDAEIQERLFTVYPQVSVFFSCRVLPSVALHCDLTTVGPYLAVSHAQKGPSDDEAWAMPHRSEHCLGRDRLSEKLQSAITISAGCDAFITRMSACSSLVLQRCTGLFCA